MSTSSLFLAFLLGFFGGLRSFTAPAATAWAVRLGWLKLGSSFAWMGSLPSMIGFSLGALGELVADKLPKTPSRTAPPGLIARLVLGGLCGGAVYLAGTHGSWVVGSIAGAAGGLLGCFGGYQLRTRLVKMLGTPDFVVAVAEDAIAIAGSLWAVSRF